VGAFITYEQNEDIRKI
jgi:hypothetical protein